MSKSNIARRIALFSTTSLGLAAIASAASLGVALTPGAAAAATNPCGVDPSTGASTPDVIVCPTGTYATGIQHTSEGDLDVTAQWVTNFGSGGMVTTAGELNDDLTVRFIGNLTSSNTTISTTAPVLFDVESQAGDILVDLAVFRGSSASIQVTNPTTTHFVRAISTDGGDVTVNRIKDNVVLTGAGAFAGLEARSFGGGDVTLTGGTYRVDQGQYGILASVDGVGDLTVNSSGEARGAAGIAGIHATTTGSGDITLGGRGQGRLYGIVAQTTGSGDLTINNAQSNDSRADTTAGIAAIWARTGSGLLTINTTSFGPDGGAGTGLLIDAGGDVAFTGGARGGQYGIDIPDVAAGTTTTLNLSGAVTGGIADIRAAGDGEVVVEIVGSTSSLNFDFSGMAAPVEVAFDEGTIWRANGASGVGTNMSIEIADDSALIAGTVITGGDVNQLEPATVLTFSDPTVVLNNAGYIVVGPDLANNAHQPRRHEAELRMIGLGEFHHSGSIVLGGCGNPCIQGNLGLDIQGTTVDITDSWRDDLFVFEGGGWIGEGGRILFDVDVNLTQPTCTREAVTNDFGAADCVRIIDSTVEGVTYVHLNQLLGGDRGRLTQQIMDEGILLIDAPGSTVTAENFVLDPETDGYNAEANSLDKGLYQYVFLFDEEDSQFRLTGTLSGAAYQLPIAATTAHNLWRLSTGTWLERQADLRGGIEPGVGGGVWMRATGEQADREVVTTTTLAGLPFTTDSTHTAKSYAITGGVDLLSASTEDMGYVVGLMAGYAHADVEYDASSNTQAMDGWTGGLYASFLYGGLFVDAAVNANNVILDTDNPGFDFEPEGTILSSRLFSIGGQVEAGYRFPFSDGFFVEPLASVSYVRSQMEDLEIVPDDGDRPGLEVTYEDPSSFRAGLGGRIGMDRDFGGIRTQFSVLGRAWNDLEGQNTAVIHNLAFPDDPEIRVEDDFRGRFNELQLGAAVYSPGGIVSGFVNLGGKFAEDYTAKNGSVGVRVAW